MGKVDLHSTIVHYSTISLILRKIMMAIKLLTRIEMKSTVLKSILYIIYWSNLTSNQQTGWNTDCCSSRVEYSQHYISNFHLLIVPSSNLKMLQYFKNNQLVLGIYLLNIKKYNKIFIQRVYILWDTAQKYHSISNCKDCKVVFYKSN